MPCLVHKLTLLMNIASVKECRRRKSVDVHRAAALARLALMKRFEDHVKETFGQRLRAARLAAGHEAASHFADALGVEENRYRHWERGSAMPDIPMVTRICELLDVEPNDLLPLATRKRRRAA
jgi:ribosome-binding protein aMBF1 (putative translation factor)